MQIIIALLLITVLNILVTQARTWHTAARDSRRLQRALLAEAVELSRLIAGNIARLRAGTPYLLSLRACTFVYRGNIQRLGFIPDRQIEPLVRAYAICEQVEHIIAATTRAQGAMAFRIIDNETPRDEILRELERAEAAIRMLLVPPLPMPADESVREDAASTEPLVAHSVAGRP